MCKRWLDLIQAFGHYQGHTTYSNNYVFVIIKKNYNARFICSSKQLLLHIKCFWWTVQKVCKMLVTRLAAGNSSPLASNWSGIYSHLAAVAQVDVVKCHPECQQVIRWQQSRAASLSTRFVPPPSTVLTLLRQAVVYSTAH